MHHFSRAPIGSVEPRLELGHLDAMLHFGGAAHTVTSRDPLGYRAAQTGIARIALKPRATASNSVSASTHTLCSTPSMSVTEMRQARVGTLGL